MSWCADFEFRVFQWSWMNCALYVLLAATTGMCWWRVDYEEDDIFLRMSLVSSNPNTGTVHAPSGPPSLSLR